MSCPPCSSAAFLHPATLKSAAPSILQLSPVSFTVLLMLFSFSIHPFFCLPMHLFLYLGKEGSVVYSRYWCGDASGLKPLQAGLWLNSEDIIADCSLSQHNWIMRKSWLDHREVRPISGQCPLSRALTNIFPNVNVLTHTYVLYLHLHQVLTCIPHIPKSALVCSDITVAS